MAQRPSFLYHSSNIKKKKNECGVKRQYSVSIINFASMQVADYQSPTVLANYVLLLSYLSKVLKYSTKANYSIQKF